MTTAFVTGGTGFIGLNVIDELTKEGARVVALHRAGSDIKRLQTRNVELAVGSITDRASLERAIPERCDIVFHIAGNTSLWAGDRDVQTRDNVEGTRNVVEAALARKAKKLVYTSSVSAYGAQPHVPFDESAPLMGATSEINYERTKCLAELEVKRGIERGLDAVILNPAHVVGRFDQRSWGRLFFLVNDGKLPGIPPGGGSFADGEHVATAHVRAARQGKTGENYILGGVDASYVEMITIIGQLLGKKVPARATPAWILGLLAQVLRVGPVFTKRAPVVTPEMVSALQHPFYVRSDKAIRELGYEVTPLEEMLRKCHSWLVEEKLLR